MFHLSGGAQEYNSDDLIDDFSSTSKQDIKNVRLCCRLLSAIASRYLIDRIRVEVSSSSLSRFEKVCNHPLIRHGVRAVQVCLAQYDDAFDGNLEGFIQYHKESLDRDVQLQAIGSDDDTFLSHTWGKYLEALAAQDHDLPDIFDHREVACIQDLQEGYRLYQCGLIEQKSFPEGNFAARVSASMANLPVGLHLELTDWDTVRWEQGWSLSRLVHASKHKSVIHMFADCRSPFIECRGNTFLHLIPNLTSANITSLYIKISSRVYDYTDLSLLSRQENQLRSNLRKLRSFKFDNYESFGMWEVDRPGFRALAHFLNACLGSESLERLEIRPHLGELSSEGSLISPRPWTRLKSAVLCGVRVSEADLDVLTGSIASQPGGSLMLGRVHLYCGGTWARVLDMLRDKRICVDLGGQCGAEWETDPGMAWEMFARHSKNPPHILDFHPFPNYDAEGKPIPILPSFAEYYVQGEDMPNPLLNPPDQGLRDRLFGVVPNNDGHPDDQGHNHGASDEEAAV